MREIRIEVKTLELFLDIEYLVEIYCSIFIICRLKLFLEQFGIQSCVLNSELPAASRCHAVSQFNNDMFKIIIASDEKAFEDALDRRMKKK